MIIREAGIKGFVEVIARDAKTGEIVKRIVEENVIVDSGANLLINAWLNGKYLKYKASPDTNDGSYISNYGRPHWAMVLGTGTGTPSTSDTDLFNPIPETARGAGQDGLSISIQTDPETGLEYADITPLPWGSVAELTQLPAPDRGWQYHVRYMPEDGNGYTFTELGIFENIPYHWYSINNVYHEYYIPPQHYTDGVLFEHAVLSQSLTKTLDILVDVYVTIKIQP